MVKCQQVLLPDPILLAIKADSSKIASWTFILILAVFGV